LQIEPAVGVIYYRGISENEGASMRQVGIVLVGLSLVLGAGLWSGCSESSSDGGSTTAGDAAGSTTTGEDTSVSCEGFLETYLSAVAGAKACTGAGDCGIEVADTLFCGCPTWVSSDSVVAALQAIRKSSNDAGCPEPGCLAVECPYLPPAVCKEGACWADGQDPVCLNINGQISEAFDTGGACESDPDCSAWVEGGLGCSCGNFVTSADAAEQLKGLIGNYSSEGCYVLECGPCPPPNYVGRCKNGQCKAEQVSCLGITNEFKDALQAAKACADASECLPVEALGLDCPCPYYLAVADQITEAKSLAATYQLAGCALICNISCAGLETAACLDGECRSVP
jgi:hypothetical protein